jgi:ATP-dependent Clp protease protease subunit
LGDIESSIADSMDAYIRFFNRLDEEEGIPVEEREPIKIYVDSGGGDVMGTLTVIDAIKNSKTPVWTINIGQAYSGGFFVFIAGHKRLSYKNATFLFHEGSTGSSGDVNKFNNWADFLKKVIKRLKTHVLENTKITEEEYEKHSKDDWWLFAEEAVEHGICDEIIEELI